MADIELVAKKLAEAGLRLEAAAGPFGGRGSDQVFGLDIRKDVFRVWPGADANKIVVTGVDKEKQQAVMMVHEAARTFEQELPANDWRSGKPTEIPAGARVVGHPSKYRMTVEMTTPAAKRHFLMGIDERGSFVAQLPKGVSTVREAHEVLKSPTAKEKKVKARSAGEKVIRQGEWFFFKITDVERSVIEANLKKKTSWIEKKTAIAVALDRRAGRGAKQNSGNPHVVDEIVVIATATADAKVARVLGKTLYVRGKVRHKEHATVEFKDWHRVERNAEVLQQGRAAGINWVD